MRSRRGPDIVRWGIVIVLVFLIVVIALYLLQGIGGDIVKVYHAGLCVNGERLEDHACIYWYGETYHEGAADATIPFFSLLRGLGCQIDRDESRPDSDATILAGNRQFFYQAGTHNLYENEKLVTKISLLKDEKACYTDVPFWRRYDGNEEGYDQLHMDARKCESVLRTLGFDQITLEIDGEALVVKITATPKQR